MATLTGTYFETYGQTEGIAGAFSIASDDGGLFYVCPCGCGIDGYLPFRERTENPERPSWEWDGDRQKPTLSPSIRRTAGCLWHGFLEAGIWRSA